MEKPEYWVIEAGQAREWGLNAALLYAHIVEDCAAAPDGWARLPMRLGDVPQQWGLEGVVTEGGYMAAIRRLRKAKVIKTRHGEIRRSDDTPRRAFDLRRTWVRIARPAELTAEATAAAVADLEVAA